VSFQRQHGWPVSRSHEGKANISRPMPKARNHIAALAEQHDKQSQKIEELERLIAEVH